MINSRLPLQPPDHYISRQIINFGSLSSLLDIGYVSYLLLKIAIQLSTSNILLIPPLLEIRAKSLFQSYYKQIDNVKWIQLFLQRNLHLNLTENIFFLQSEFSNAKYNLHNVRRKGLKRAANARERRKNEVAVIMENTCSSMTESLM